MDIDRILWIKAELEDEPTRTPYGTDGRDACRNGHEIAHLEVELMTLQLEIATALINDMAGHEGAEGFSTSTRGLMDLWDKATT